MPAALLYFTGTMELIGGFLITIGLFTRPVAFILAGFMAVSYFMVHFPQSFFPAKNYGEPAVTVCFVFFYLSAVGCWALGGWGALHGSGSSRRRPRKGTTP